MMFQLFHHYRKMLTKFNPFLEISFLGTVSYQLHIQFDLFKRALH